MFMNKSLFQGSNRRGDQSIINDLTEIEHTSDTTTICYNKGGNCYAVWLLIPFKLSSRREHLQSLLHCNCSANLLMNSICSNAAAKFNRLG